MLYRVTFTTSLVVQSPDPHSAERIAYRNLREELSHSELHSIDHITHVNQLRRSEYGSLPWVDLDVNNNLTLEEILGVNNTHPPDCPWHTDWHSCTCEAFQK